ncbi:MAG: STAS domain-containing protein [Prevotella sp.]
MFKFRIIENTPELLAIEMNGELNTMAANELHQQVDIYRHVLNKHVLIDVTNLNYISSTGLREFLLIKKGSAANGQTVTIKGMNKTVASIFKMTGFDKMFEIL